MEIVLVYAAFADLWLHFHLQFHRTRPLCRTHRGERRCEKEDPGSEEGGEGSDALPTVMEKRIREYQEVFLPNACYFAECNHLKLQLFFSTQLARDEIGKGTLSLSLSRLNKLLKSFFLSLLQDLAKTLECKSAKCILSTCFYFVNCQFEPIYS